MFTTAIRQSRILASFSPRYHTPSLSALIHSRPFSHSIPFKNNQNNQSNQHVSGIRQKRVPLAGSNEDAESAISGFMNMFNDKDSRTVTISACSKHGFVTTESITLHGPVICLGGQVFLWDIFKESGAVAKLLQRQQINPSSPSPSPPDTPAPIFESMDEDTAKEIFKVSELMNPRPGNYGIIEKMKKVMRIKYNLVPSSIYIYSCFHRNIDHWNRKDLFTT